VTTGRRSPLAQSRGVVSGRFGRAIKRVIAPRSNGSLATPVAVGDRPRSRPRTPSGNRVRPRPLRPTASDADRQMQRFAPTRLRPRRTSLRATLSASHGRPRPRDQHRGRRSCPVSDVQRHSVRRSRRAPSRARRTSESSSTAHGDHRRHDIVEADVSRAETLADPGPTVQSPATSQQARRTGDRRAGSRRDVEKRRWSWAISRSDRRIARNVGGSNDMTAASFQRDIGGTGPAGVHSLTKRRSPTWMTGHSTSAHTSTSLGRSSWRRAAPKGRQRANLATRADG
jgi:hypothetical protein